MPQRLLIGRDHVIKDMLEGLGANVVEISAPFSPLRGAYWGQEHGHAHHHHG
jgi:urease accessory protein